MLNCSTPLKTIRDKRLAYLASLENIYKEEGYVTRLSGRNNLLEVFPKGAALPKNDETVIERWID